MEQESRHREPELAGFYYSFPVPDGQCRSGHARFWWSSKSSRRWSRMLSPCTLQVPPCRQSGADGSISDNLRCQAARSYCHYTKRTRIRLHNNNKMSPYKSIINYCRRPRLLSLWLFEFAFHSPFSPSSQSRARTRCTVPPQWEGKGAIAYGGPQGTGAPRVARRGVRVRHHAARAPPFVRNKIAVGVKSRHPVPESGSGYVLKASGRIFRGSTASGDACGLGSGTPTQPRTGFHSWTRAATPLSTGMAPLHG